MDRSCLMARSSPDMRSGVAATASGPSPTLPSWPGWHPLSQARSEFQASRTYDLSWFCGLERGLRETRTEFERVEEPLAEGVELGANPLGAWATSTGRDEDVDLANGRERVEHAVDAEVEALA